MPNTVILNKGSEHFLVNFDKCQTQSEKGIDPNIKILIEKPKESPYDILSKTKKLKIETINDHEIEEYNCNGPQLIVEVFYYNYSDVAEFLNYSKGELPDVIIDLRPRLFQAEMKLIKRNGNNYNCRLHFKSNNMPLEMSPDIIEYVGDSDFNARYKYLKGLEYPLNTHTYCYTQLSIETRNEFERLNIAPPENENKSNEEIYICMRLYETSAFIPFVALKKYDARYISDEMLIHLVTKVYLSDFKTKSICIESLTRYQIWEFVKEIIKPFLIESEIKTNIYEKIMLILKTAYFEKENIFFGCYYTPLDVTKYILKFVLFSNYYENLNSRDWSEIHPRSLFLKQNKFLKNSN